MDGRKCALEHHQVCGHRREDVGRLCQIVGREHLLGQLLGDGMNLRVLADDDDSFQMTHIYPRV